MERTLLAGLLAAVSLLSAAPAVLGNHTPRQEGKTWSLSTTTINVPNTDDGTHYNHWRCTQTTCSWGSSVRSNGGTLQRSCNVPYGGGDGSCQQYGHSAPAGSGFRWLSGGEHHYTTWPTPRTYAVAVCSRDIGEGAAKSAVDANGHPVKSSNSFCGVWTPTATTQPDSTGGDDSDDDSDDTAQPTPTPTPAPTPPPAPTVVSYGGCRIGDPQATLAGLKTRDPKYKFNPYSWPDYRHSNGWSWRVGVEEHPGPVGGSMASDAYYAPTTPKELTTGDTEMWFRAEVRNPTYEGSPPVREHPEGVRASRAGAASQVSIRGNTWRSYSDGRYVSTTGTCGIVKSYLTGLEVAATGPGVSVTYYNITWPTSGVVTRVPPARDIRAGGTVWGASGRVQPISEWLLRNSHQVRSAAGVFKAAFGEGSGSRNYTVTISAVWEIRISGVTRAGLAVKETDGTTYFCDRTDTSGRTDGGGTCIREMKLSTQLIRSYPNRWLSG